MPIYRDRRGRFTTRAFWEELFNPPPEPEPEPEPEADTEVYSETWYTSDISDVTQVWSTQWYDAEGKPHGDIVPLDMDAVRAADFPSGFSGYKAIYSVLDSPSYPRGYMTSEPYYYNQWPPPDPKSQGGKALIAIRFF